MNLQPDVAVEFIFGKSPSSRDTLREPPPHVRWRSIRPRDADPVRAHVAASNCTVNTSHGKLHARAGADMIVDHEGDAAVVRRDIFDRTYKAVGGGLYRKRQDIVLRYFTLQRPVMVETIEGPQRAEAGDWIIEGVAGELWPVAAEKALEKYEPL